MSWLMKRLVLALLLVAAGCLAAGCAQGSNIKKAVASLSPSVTVTPPTVSPRTRTPRPTTSPATPAVVPPTASAPPSSQAAVPPAASPSPAASQSSAETGSASTGLWLAILAGVLVVVAAAVLIARHVGRRSAKAASWRSKLADTRAKGSALYDAMSMAEVPGASAPREASARWTDIQRRADDLAQTLYELQESAPDEAARARVTDVLTSLQVVRSAMNAEYSPGGAGPAQGARVHELLMSFDASLRALRPPGDTF